MKRIYHFLFTATLLLLTACSSDDNGPLSFTIEEKELQIEDARAINISSGNLDYTIDVEDPSIVDVIYRTPYDNESYGDLYFVPRKMGKTIVVVTDNICKTSISLQVEVLEKKGGRGTIIKSSNHPLFIVENLLVFSAYDTSKQFSIKEPQDDTYVIKKEGIYALRDWEGKKYISLTYKNDNGEEVTETYDISESDPAALSSLYTDLRWEYESQTKMASKSPTYEYLRMKGENNEYNISAIVGYTQSTVFQTPESRCLSKNQNKKRNQSNSSFNTSSDFSTGKSGKCRR